MCILKHLTLAILIAAWPAFAGAQGALEKRDVHVGRGGKASLYYLRSTIAEQLGYFKERALSVTIKRLFRRLAGAEGGGGRERRRSYREAYEHTLNMQPKGQYLQCFVQQGRAPQIAIGIATARAKTTSRRKT